ncbi:hypothetical protein ACFLSJ_08880, partial [Verrucomicrobiota bacterium]
MAVLTALLCLWATLPFGAVTTWARSTVVLGCMLIFIVGLALRTGRGDSQDRAAAGDGQVPYPDRIVDEPVALALAGLLLWVVFQCIPLPMGLLRGFLPGGRDTLQSTLTGSPMASLAFDRFVSRSTLTMWLGYALLVWTGAWWFRTRKAVRLLGWLLAAIGTFQALFGIVCWNSGMWDNNPFAAARVAGTFSGPNAFGGLMTITIIATLGTVFSILPRLVESRNSRNPRVLLAALQTRNDLFAATALTSALIPQTVALLLSGSRGAIISTTVGIALLTAWYLLASVGRIKSDLLRFGTLLVFVIALLGSGG